MATGDVRQSCPACEGYGTFTLVQEGGRLLVRCTSCGHDIEIAIVRCCDLHGCNCEPEEQCCRYCTEARCGAWTDERGVQRHGHPEGEACAASDKAIDEILASSEHKRVISEVLRGTGSSRVKCRWCGKPNRAPSDWEQQNVSSGEWHRLCVRCAGIRLRNPYSALLAMRKISTEGES